jgi:hypothetical protein
MRLQDLFFAYVNSKNSICAGTKKNSAPITRLHCELSSMSQSTISVPSITARAKRIVCRGKNDARHIAPKMPCAPTRVRSKSTHDDENSTKHKIVVFNRSSFVSHSTQFLQNPEVGEFHGLEDCVPISRFFSQDDCLHSESAPLPPPMHKSSRLARTRYNFQQGLLNTKEVLAMQRYPGNARITLYEGSEGRRLSIGCSQFPKHG